MTIADQTKDVLLKTVNVAHKAIVAVSGGRLGATAANLPVVKLTTVGRVSGKPRTVMLTTPIQEDGRYVLVASKGGDDRDPDWYRNLVANPEVVLEPINGNGPMMLRARTATPDEKADLWPRIATGDRGYAAYEAKTSRDIPVVICEAPDSWIVLGRAATSTAAQRLPSNPPTNPAIRSGSSPSGLARFGQ